MTTFNLALDDDHRNLKQLEPTNMVTLRVRNLHWLNRDNESADLCAHGTVEFAIDGHTIRELESLDCTVSAAGLYLLRTLERPHIRGDQEHLFPCCGFTMYDLPETADVLIMGCVSGVDLEVRPGVDSVQVALPDGAVHCISPDAWRLAVFGFADEVSSFYRSSAPKQPAPEDSAGFQKFRSEWRIRRGTPLC